MTTFWVEGKTVYRVEEMCREQVTKALGKIFKNKDFSNRCTKSLREKLKRSITNDKELSFESY